MTTNKRSSTGIFSYNPVTEIDMITEELMTKSFFLPVDVICNHHWHVHPITVVTQEQFGNLVDPWLESFPANRIHYEAGFVLACFAKFIGISARKHRTTGEIYLIIKPWYGKNPYTPSEGDTVSATPEQIDSLISFTSL